MSDIEVIVDMPAEYSGMVFGQFDEYAREIERNLKVDLIARDGVVKLIGEKTAVDRAKGVLDNLTELARRGNQISRQNVDYAISLSFDDKENSLLEIDSDTVCRTIAGKPIKPKTLGQKNYVDQIRDKMIVFGIGPAGTGKTYLAMAMAIQAFKNNEVNKIILTRPAIEAGEKLGFLPGDLQSKVDPYLRPLYDALFDMIGPDKFNKYLERGNIEVAPLAFMRGRTLDNAFIILDEAQNTTPEQMKMFLTRLGFGSKAVVTGDITQTDLPNNKKSGLLQATKILKNVSGIGSMELTEKDVVRHELVQRIIRAYEKFEKKEDHNLNKKQELKAKDKSSQK